MTPQKKRHHYLAVSYLARFTDAHGFLYAYRKDEPDKVLRSKPEAIAFQKYYYSQPLPGGGYDHNVFEDGLSELESDWPALAARISAGENINNREDLGYLLNYMALQRVRVPAARDLAEKALANQVMRELRTLDATGELPPKPEGLENLLDLVQITIDPHKSMHAMRDLLPHLTDLFDSIGYEILHNETPISLITSDNPVIYFDPTVPERSMRPYAVARPSRPMELLFPVDPFTLIHGHSDLRDRFTAKGAKHVRLRDAQSVRRINRLAARFGYELIIAADTSHGALVKAFADKSPVLSERNTGPNGMIMLEMVFGSRTPKPKWSAPPVAEHA